MAGTWNLADLFEAVVDRVGPREAVVSGVQRLTYDQLDGRANRVAHVLARHGVGPGDRVGLSVRNGHEHLAALLGAYKLRAVPFNVNYRYTADEMAYLFADARPRVVLHGPDVGPAVDQAVAARHAAGDTLVALPGRGPSHEGLLAASSPVRPDVPGRSGGDRYLLYTGGTTGMPKGVEWRHEDIVFAALGAGSGAPILTPDGPAATSPAQMAARADDGRTRTLPASPLIHGTAQWVALATLLAGGTVLTLPSSTFVAGELWDLAQAERASLVVIVGDAFARPLADALAEHPGRWDLGDLVAVVSGGAVLSPAVRTQLAAQLPWVAVVDGYGTSETGGQGNAVSWPGQSPAAHTRFPLDDHTALLDEEGSPLVPGIHTGRIGRLARRGHIPLGYRNDPERTAATFPVIEGERWAVPGDLGRMEDDGTVTLLGRGASSINTGGEKVFPDEVEAALKAHPAVFDAAVVGVPDERWGERVVAVVAARQGAAPTFEELDAHCRERLAAFKVPRRVVPVAVVRRLPSGKTDHAWVRDVARRDALATPAP
ncbi:AMP-binding protein [Iamia majanohamensis]|uniref:AMP-binding protein n=1 Tax=Iamia majanohamensis TaxID=467976 RepID=A0AAE9YDV0_9ACTN|nr:AMP-binding protein [Iamia majanohamensis]WCO69014.1 AMP-binding protein [Iamia majanohamensis]